MDALDRDVGEILTRAMYLIASRLFRKAQVNGQRSNPGQMPLFSQIVHQSCKTACRFVSAIRPATWSPTSMPSTSAPRISREALRSPAKTRVVVVKVGQVLSYQAG